MFISMSCTVISRHDVTRQKTSVKRRRSVIHHSPDLWL